MIELSAPDRTFIFAGRSEDERWSRGLLGTIAGVVLLGAGAYSVFRGDAPWKRIHERHEAKVAALKAQGPPPPVSLKRVGIGVAVGCLVPLVVVVVLMVLSAK